MELQIIKRLGCSQEFLYIAIGEHFQRVRIYHLFHGFQSIAILRFTNSSQFIAWIFGSPQTVIKAYFGFQAMRTADPMKSFSFNLAIGTWLSTTCVGIVSAINGCHTAFFVLVARMILVTLDDIGILQTNLLAWSQAHEFLFCNFHEIIALNPEFTTEFNLMCAVSLVFRVIYGSKHFNLVFGIIGYDKLYGVKYGAHSGSTLVQVIAHSTFEQCKIIQRIVCRITNFVNKVTNTFWGISATTESTDCRHTRIIPTIDQSFFYKNQQVALAHEGIVEIQFVELILTRTVVVKVFTILYPINKKVIKRTMGNKLQRTE